MIHMNFRRSSVFYFYNERNITDHEKLVWGAGGRPRRVRGQQKLGSHEPNRFTPVTSADSINCEEQAALTTPGESRGHIYSRQARSVWSRASLANFRRRACVPDPDVPWASR
jgi:hypothetical protein